MHQVSEIKGQSVIHAPISIDNAEGGNSPGKTKQKENTHRQKGASHHRAGKLAGSWLYVNGMHCARASAFHAFHVLGQVFFARG